MTIAICPECGGEGCHEIPRPQRDDPFYCEVAQCRHCGGVGRIEEDGPSEQAIYEDFANGGLKYLDAVQHLQGTGYDPKEAERVVTEWADGLDKGPDPMRGPALSELEIAALCGGKNALKLLRQSK